MKKIIVKTKVKNREELEERLDKKGIELGTMFWQHDRIFLPRGYRAGANFPRFILRTEMKAIDRPPKYYLILKRHIEDSDIEIEHETEVKEYLEAVGMVTQLGLELKGEVSRRREEAKLGNRERLYLDRIDGASGSFLKIEAEVAEGASVEAVRREVEEELKELGGGEIIKKMYWEM